MTTHPLLHRPRPDGPLVLWLVHKRTVWFFVALLAAVLVLSLVPSTVVGSQSDDIGLLYRAEWTCPTFGESTVSVTGARPDATADVNPCASEAASRRLLVTGGAIVGVFGIVASLLFRRGLAVWERSAKAPGPAADAGED